MNPDIVSDVEAVRARRRILVEKKMISDVLSSPLMTNKERLAVVVEELGEVATAVNDDVYGDMCSELVQMVACCIEWLELLYSFRV